LIIQDQSGSFRSNLGHPGVTLIIQEHVDHPEASPPLIIKPYYLLLDYPGTNYLYYPGAILIMQDYLDKRLKKKKNKPNPQ